MQGQGNIYELIVMSPQQVQEAGYLELATAMQTGIVDASGFPSMSGYGRDMNKEATLAEERRNAGLCVQCGISMDARQEDGSCAGCGLI